MVRRKGDIYGMNRLRRTVIMEITMEDTSRERCSSAVVSERLRAVKGGNSYKVMFKNVFED